MAKYEQYAEYKDSEVEWLEKVPSHWQPVPIKYLASEKDTLFLDGDWIESKDISDSGIRYITTGNVGEGQYKEQGTGFISDQVFQKLNCSEVFEQDILISRLNLPIGRACLVPNLNNRIVTSVDNVILRPDAIYSKQFLVHLFSSSEYFHNTANLARGATMQRISRGLLGNIRISLPKKQEQIQIANFLDHETAQIDTLIKKQQTLIQLLKEKRQAVISHAVTKGLNPDAPMKDSGVEWLGNVPEHWDIGRLKNVLRIRNGRDYKAVEVEIDGYPVYGSGGVFRRSSQYLFDGVSVLFGRKGTIDKPLLVSGKFWTVDTMFYSEIFDNAMPEYIYHQALLFPFDMLSTNTALPSMTQEDLLNLGFVMPPLNEQEEICQYLNEKLKVFSGLVGKATTAIQLMQERRTALISAAVTGKIDVRGWQAAGVEA